MKEGRANFGRKGESKDNSQRGGHYVRGNQQVVGIDKTVLNQSLISC